MSSAEWIEEMPLVTGTSALVPLDNFGTIPFNNAWTIVNGIRKNIREAGGRSMNMINSAHQVLVTTSSLSLDGSSFSLTRTNAKSLSTMAILN